MARVREEFLLRLDRSTRQFLREAVGAGHVLADLDGDYCVSIRDGQISGVEIADENAKVDGNSPSVSGKPPSTSTRNRAH